MKTLIGACVVALAVVTLSAETKLGAGVTLKEATPVKALIEKPADYVGKTIRVDGVATAVCEHMGCWMAIAPEGDPNGTAWLGDRIAHAIVSTAADPQPPRTNGSAATPAAHALQ